MSAFSDDLKGKMDEAVGKITGDEKREAKGNVEQIASNLKDRAEELKNTAGEKVNEVLNKVKDRTEKEDEEK